MKVGFHKARRDKKKVLLKLAKGMRGRKNRCANIAKDHVVRRFKNKYIGRKLRKRDMRSLWIMRMNAALRMYDRKYSEFINVLNTIQSPLNRKSMAEMAAREPEMFKQFVDASYAAYEKLIAGNQKQQAVAA